MLTSVRSLQSGYRIIIRSGSDDILSTGISIALKKGNRIVKAVEPIQTYNQ